MGKLPEARYDLLSDDYEQEQAVLRTALADDEAALAQFTADTARVDQFLAPAKKYTDFTELTTPMINEFIDKIIVHAPTRDEYGDRCQQVEIHLNFIGKFDVPLPEPTPEEIKRQEQLKRHRIRSRERYQEIKADEHKVGEPYTLTCKCCGNSFESPTPQALFCDPNCRSKFYLRKAAEKRRRECVCGNCGKAFSTTRNNVKFCCDDCRYQGQLKRQRAQKAEKRAAEKANLPCVRSDENNENVCMMIDKTGGGDNS